MSSAATVQQQQDQEQARVLLTVRPALLADLMRKALADVERIDVVVAHDPSDLPWQEPWEVAILSTDALDITDVTNDAFVVYVPGGTPMRVASPDVGELVALVRELARLNREYRG